MSNAPWPAKRWELTRELIASGEVRRRIVASGYPFPILSEAELEASLAAILAARQGRETWVFGYGSLMWNPAFHYAERRVGRVHGFHRRFCLWTHAGRGTPDNPGLMLALERGGSCRGVAFRLAEHEAETELGIVWKREMVSGAYAPRWITVRTEAGTIRAVTFVINHRHERYTGLLPENRVAEVIASAAGPLGACAEYLHNTVEHLGELGVVDRPLFRLHDQVMERRRG
jgi:glutathione-specific gamma-glutamylcyclotransferase